MLAVKRLGPAKKGVNARAGKPLTIDPKRRDWLKWTYPGDDLIDKLLLVTDLDNTLRQITWRLSVDGPAVLTQAERDFLTPVYDHAGQLKPWDLLLTHVIAGVNDPAIQADDDVYKLAEFFVRLAGLAQQAGTSRLVIRALMLANLMSIATAPTRVSGDDLRERVKAAWLADARVPSSKEHGRISRVAKALKEARTTVGAAVHKLRELGQLQGIEIGTDD